jgi:hypothetical protein
MRPIERIDNFLKRVNWEKLSTRWSIDLSGIDKSQEYGTSTYNNLLLYWKENPDQRIGQVLINLGLIPDNLKIWMDEESDILLDQELSPEEVLFWGRNYDKDNNLLDHTEYILIKDLTSDHINAIYDWQFKLNKRLNPLYMTAFKNVLISRGESIDHIQTIEDLWNKEITEVIFE